MWSSASRFLVARAVADAAIDAARNGGQLDWHDLFLRPPAWTAAIEVPPIREHGPTTLDATRSTVEARLFVADRRRLLPVRPTRLLRWSVVELRCDGWAHPEPHGTGPAWTAAERRHYASVLADAFLAAEWAEPALFEAARGTGLRAPCARSIAEVLVRVLRHPPVDAPRATAALVEMLLHEQEALGRLPRPRTPARTGPLTRARMGRLRWPVPEVATASDLAALLDLHPGELLWLSDVRSWERRVTDDPLRNYRYWWIDRGDRVAARLIETPKSLLRETQRRVLHQILDRIPCHEAAHGFRRGHSVVTHARRHVGRGIVFRWDLRDFFGSIQAGRIYGIFRSAGYPEHVARLLTGLTTNAAPSDILAAMPGHQPDAWLRRRRLAEPHLPQGAPTSPMLANLAAYRLDCRLSGLATAFGCAYSRYADDLVLSTDRRLGREIATLHRLVGAIVADEGFALNVEKTRLMPRSSRQRVCGVVVNEMPNVSRAEVDVLRAVLHDALRNGLAHANRAGHPDFRAHLTGRIGWVAQVNPTKGARLRAMLDAVQ